MANTVVEKVEVKSLTKFGFIDATDKAIYTSKTKDEASKLAVVPGKFLEVELYVADSGTRYLNKVLKQLDTQKVGDTPEKVTESVTNSKPAQPEKFTSHKGKTEEMTRADWDAKDTRISRQGVIQAAVQAVAHLGLTATKDVFPTAEKLADQMLAYVNQK
jgi:hypothetical protein